MTRVVKNFFGNDRIKTHSTLAARRISEEPTRVAFFVVELNEGTGPRPSQLKPRQTCWQAPDLTLPSALAVLLRLNP